MRLPLLRHGYLVLMLLLVSCRPDDPPDSAFDGHVGVLDDRLRTTDTVAEWDGEPIAYGELAWMMARLRSGVVQAFRERYGVEYADGFWTTAFDGRETPETVLKHMALQELGSYKAEQKLAKRYGVIEDGSYQALYAAFIRENQARQAAVDNNEPVYGPIQYTEFNYLDYIRHNMNLRTEEAIARNSEPPDEQTLKAFYDKVKSSELRKPDKMVVRIWRYAMPSLEDEREAAAKVHRAIRELREGRSAEEVLSDADPALTQTERTFDETTYREDVRYHSSLYALALRLSEGEIGEPVTRGREMTFIQCLERQAGRLQSYEEALVMLKKRFTHDQYQSEVDREVQRGALRIDEANLTRVRVN
ncbi:hypothetical protein ACF3MZ_05400 [Paenibacillaceae bacterium WGS1546]|uniref:peptidylprolyl isomerase n=1 Tax=Cohnella sp. WGS1546 TaxID=3366810 RepID=UPI00372D74E0